MYTKGELVKWECVRYGFLFKAQGKVVKRIEEGVYKIRLTKDVADWKKGETVIADFYPRVK